VARVSQNFRSMNASTGFVALLVTGLLALGCHGTDQTTIEGSVQVTSEGLDTGFVFETRTALLEEPRDEGVACGVGHCVIWEDGRFGELVLSRIEQDVAGLESIEIYDPEGEGWIEVVIDGQAYSFDGSMDESCLMFATDVDVCSGSARLTVDCDLGVGPQGPIHVAVDVTLESCQVD